MKLIHLKKHNLTKTLSQARNDAKKKGLIDDKLIMNKSKKTRSKSYSNSNSQEMTRTLISHYFNQFLLERDIKNLEVIVGYDEWSILKDREVDIPIIIIDTNSNRFFKFSVEMNSKWHINRSKEDGDKALSLAKKGWHHYVIDYTEQNNHVESEAKKIVIDILQSVTL